MKTYCFFSILVLTATLFYACQNQPVPAPAKAPVTSPVQTFRGLYVWDVTAKKFTDCAGGTTYTLLDETRSMDTLYRKALYYVAFDAEPVYAVVQGKLNTENTDSPTLVVTKVDTVESKNMFNCCIPYEFWCSGTEPFWDLQISEKEKGFFFKNMGAESTVRFPWSAAKTDGATKWVYEFTGSGANKGMGIKIVIKKELCSDGMSDRAFDYSAEVTMGKEVLHGCAVRWGEKIPGGE